MKGGGGVYPTVRELLRSKVCRQKSRTWGRHIPPCGNQNRLMVYWGGIERWTWKRYGVLVYLRERLWRVSDNTGQWLDQLGWRRSDLLGENRLATQKFRAKSIPSLATLQNLSMYTKGICFIQIPFLSFPSSSYILFFKTHCINPKSFLDLSRIKEKRKKEN